MDFSFKNFCLLIAFFNLMLVGCARDFSECAGPDLDVNKLNSLKSAIFASGPQGYLVVPNPMDATGIRNVMATDSRVLQAADSFRLPDLLNPLKLENNFLKIRLAAIGDTADKLAKPDASGEFNFSVSDPHYSETMAYHSIALVMEYVQTMGFSLVKTRPLYVMVRANDGGTKSEPVNAIYNHNYLNPSMPRTMKLFGDGPFAPGMDRDMYWHEFGHYLNESLSGEVGIDYSGDNGSIYSEGSALHECLADYVAESIGNKDYIGKWIARNFDTIKAGDPLRSATDTAGALDYREVSMSDGTGKIPERYQVAEWCTRAMWDFRSQMVKEDPQGGAVAADRLVWTALALLKRDTSFSQFRGALEAADQQLHCGLHNRSITQAFDKRGFVKESPALSQPLSLKASPVGLTPGDANLSPVAVAPGKQVGFNIKIHNPNSQQARNVRVKLESSDPNFRSLIYQQGLGDLMPGETLSIGSEGPLAFDYSVTGQLGNTVTKAVHYKIRILVENGPESVVEGDLLR